MLNFKKLTEKIKIPKKLRKIIIPVIAIILIMVVLFVVKAVKSKKMSQIPAVNETKVVKTDITSSITGSATIQPKDMYSVTSLVTGDVIADTFSEGDIVEKDAEVIND